MARGSGREEKRQTHVESSMGLDVGVERLAGRGAIEVLPRTFVVNYLFGGSGWVHMCSVFSDRL